MRAAMSLEHILANVDVVEIRGDASLTVTGVTHDSRRVTAGTLFVAVPGNKVDGRAFVVDAARQGASAVMFEGPFFEDLTVTQIRVSDARTALAASAAAFFEHPTSKFYLCGVTGTNGKTTLTYLLESLWLEAGRKAGVVGTINIRYPGFSQEAAQTTPESRDLQEHFFGMVSSGVQAASIEVSSHALSQRRADACHFDACVFTNLTQDHLDYHPTLEDYYLCKESLFTRLLAASDKPRKAAIICIEGVYGQRLLKALEAKRIPTVTYGFDASADIHPLSHRLGLDGVQAEVSVRGESWSLRSPLMGRFNLLNLMAALAVGIHSGLPRDVILDALSRAEGAPGRLERVSDPSGRVLFVDYAHSPDALTNVLSAVREWAPQKIITVFGCGGDRDRGKRPLMGREAARLSDICLVTSDNPRTENPDKIIEDILPGVEQTGMQPFDGKTGFLVIPDRKSAITRAVSLAHPGDVVLVAGKGHEDYQIVGTKKLAFSDQEALRQCV
jgi:UDP-N-acetylmuramoyl-L-alanyl-D-glutamate--2,6-diaminopimelate ligase